MKILVIGASGFIGREVVKVVSANQDVLVADRNINETRSSAKIDLLDKSSICRVVKKLKPQVIINCAGIVENNENASLNPTFVKNLLDGVLGSGVEVKKILLSGSAAEYGTVDEKNIPVDEDTPLKATNFYGLSKLQETALALKYIKKHKMSIVVARIFNPIGVGMHPRFLISGLIRQVQEVKRGQRTAIEVSRLDSKRDYINVGDVALALKLLAENKTTYDIYNIGSGRGTTNGEIIKIIVDYSKIDSEVKILETSKDKEPLVAIQADISRINKELNWLPTKTIENTVKEIIYAET